MHTKTPLVDFLWNPVSFNEANKATRFLGISFIGSLFIALSAQISVPFYPVPLTGQTFAVFLTGIVLGRKKGTLAIAMYLIEGLAGLPVFANGAFGVAVLMGPSGGYLLGFVPAAFVCGYFAERGFDKRYLTLFFLFIPAGLAVYLPGLFQLGFILGWDKPILELGLYPFILGDILKMALIVAVLPTCWGLLGKKHKM